MTDNDRDILQALELAEKFIMSHHSENCDGRQDCGGCITINAVRAALLQVRFYNQQDFLSSLNVAKKEYWR